MKTESFERVQKALEDIRAGRMVILVDDEDRENEGDLCMAADHATPETINFMARFGCGLICLTLTDDRVRELDLPMMVDENRSTRSTAFTISIEARHGVSTGISAADRAHTIRVAVAPNTTPADLVSPGHIFPLKGRPGGVLQRTGHTEGSVDLARMAGCSPAGVICEIMNTDGTMARRDDLVAFANTHNLTLLSIADLIAYRLQTERLVRRAKEGVVTLGTGTPWRAVVYSTDVESRQYLALKLGDPSPSGALVRVHTGSIVGDMLGVRAGSRVLLGEAIAKIESEGSGVILVFPPYGSLDADLGFHLGEDVAPAVDPGEVVRELGLGAQILADLGLGKIRLLTNRPRRIAGLEAYGLEVVEQILLHQQDGLPGESLVRH